MNAQEKSAIEYLRRFKEVMRPHEDRIEEWSSSYVSKGPKVCLLDDDPMFGKLMAKIAAKQEVDMSVCDSVDDLPALGAGDIDVFIMDYDLGGVTGPEVSEYLSSFMSDIPVLMISFSDRSEEMNMEEWPESIKEFMMKDEGGREILKRAIEHVQ